MRLEIANSIGLVFFQEVTSEKEANEEFEKIRKEGFRHQTHEGWEWIHPDYISSINFINE